MMQHKYLYRFLALLLALVLAFELLPTGVLAANTQTQHTSELQAEGDAAQEVLPGEASNTVVGEVEEYRDERVKHFRMEDGSFLAVNYGIPVHYTLDGETWTEIDNTLVLQNAAAPARAAANQAGAGLPERYGAINGDDAKIFSGNLSTGFLFSAQRGDSAVALSLLDGLTAPSGEEAAVEEETAEPSAESETADVTEASAFQPEAIEETAAPEETAPEEAFTVLQPEEAPGLSLSPTSEDAGAIPSETVSETVPETSAETEPEPSSETEPEASEAESASMDQEPLRYNRSAAAQISYPDQEEAPQSLANEALLAGALMGASADGVTGEAEDGMSRQIMPSRLRAQVLYEDVYPGVDFLYELCSHNIKESILVKEPLSGYAFSFRLGLQDLTPVLQEDGSVCLSDTQGTPIYWIPAPYMTDADGAYSEAVSYTLSPDSEGGWVLTVTADGAWMEAEDRVFPVTIDPTLIDLQGQSDFSGTVASSGTDFSSSKTNLACGYHPTYGQMEIYYHYETEGLPKIPKGCTVVRASAGFMQNDFRSGSGVNSAASTSGSIVLYMSALTQSVSNWGSHIAWASRPSHGPVLDYVNASYSTINDILLWDVTPAVKSWYESDTNNLGLVMTSNATSSTKCRAWFTYNSNIALLVSYRNTNGLESYYTYQTLGLGNAGTAYIGDYTGQVTLCKQLASYASACNPFSLELVYNSSYFKDNIAANYDICDKWGMSMHIGSGVGLNVLQRVEKVPVLNDAETGGYTTYLLYTDGDGTGHYFSKKSGDSFYSSEDGLDFTITEYATNYYRLEDEHGNLMRFANGLLYEIQDADGNLIQIQYTRTKGDTNETAPYGAGDRINKIVQKNKGIIDPITIATFHYTTYGGTTNYLDYIQDADSHKYQFSYLNYKLNEVSLDGTAILQLGMKYNNKSSIYDNQVEYIYDPVAHYGVGFNWEDGQISSYYEVTSASNSATGATVKILHTENGQTCYRDYGTDRIENSNDIYTYYTFDYACRTVNAYTTDENKTLLGASNVVYSGVGTTDKTNNRALRTASVGMAAMNELDNHGFELASPAWSFSGIVSGTNIVRSTGKPRTGQYGCKGWIKAGNTGTIGAYRTTDTLQAGVTYTLSAYVNTSECTSFSGTGVYLKVTGNLLVDGAAATQATSAAINYKTITDIDGGWVRLSVTFTMAAKGTCTIGVYNQGAVPYFYADDFQLEQAPAPSNVNLLENGSLQHWGKGWSMDTAARYYDGCGLFSQDTYAYSIRLAGDAYTESSASQTVSVNTTGQTYVLSGWAKANAVPDNKQTATGDDAAARDKHKQFGLRAILTYSNGTTEYHYVPFNPDVTDWQYVSTAIVPKLPTTPVSTIQVVCAYERNQNEAFFDNLSLTRETAQTMKYDTEGNLVSVQSTGNEEKTAGYNNGNLTSLTTGGAGTFSYTYGDTSHPHRVTAADNGIVKDTLGYTEGHGNVTSSTLQAENGAGEKIVTSTAYSETGNLVTSTTDARGKVTSSTYENTFHVMTGQPSAVTAPNSVQTTYTYDTFGRPTKTTVSGSTGGALDYAYTNGMLTTVTRTASNIAQTYTMGYDSFGNMTSIQVGSSTLMTYAYSSKNGQLKTQTYANGDKVNYTYDNLGRTSTTSTSDGTALSYAYTGDGQLYSMTHQENGTTKAVYRYTYDTLGRLMGSSQTGSVNLRASYGYDNNSRLKSFTYSIPGVIDSASQTYYYNGDAGESNTDDYSDGVLLSMSLFSNAWLNYRYDTLSRLSERDVGGILTEHYTYTPGKGTGTTTTLPQQFYTTRKGSSTSLGGYTYTYDNMGNITRATDVVTEYYWAYSYNAQGQLRYSTYYNQDDVAQERYYYYYDNAGNLTKRQERDSTGTKVLKERRYVYKNTSWKDLLTEVNEVPLTYDASGNPLSYYNGAHYTMTWRNGRQLSTVATGGKTYSYEYDANGLRTRRTNSDGGYTLYYIADGLTVGEQQYTASGSIRRTMKYLLDENNSPVGVSIHYPSYSAGVWDNYYFLKNLQGDVTAIYNSSGALQARYTYDPYGNITSVTNASGAAISPTAANVANYNPFRYRGYYYDADTGFYYLKTRYYDPELGRFISADSFASTGQGILGFNAFAYCINNPVNLQDSLGTRPFASIMLTDSGWIDSPPPPVSPPVQCGSGCEKFSEHYLNSDYYPSDLEKYGTSYNGGSAYCHVNIVNTQQIYSPPGFFHKLIDNLWNNLIVVPTVEKIAEHAPELFNKSSINPSMASFLVSSAIAIAETVNQEINGPQQKCDIYSVTITTTYNGNPIYGMSGITNSYTSQVTIFYGIEHGTGNLFPLPNQ